METLMSKMRQWARKNARKAMSIGLSALLVFGMTAIDFDAAFAAKLDAEDRSASTGASSGLSVTYRTQAEISKALEAVWDLDYAAEYSQEPQKTAPYSAGKLAAKTQENALAFLNAIRYVAGLDYNVQIKDEYTEMAQACALLNSVNGKLDHYPTKPADMDDALYSTGYTGANKGNLVFGTKNFRRALLLLVDDQGVSSLGHRRWILFPGMECTGFGMVDNYSSMYAHDNFTSSTVGSDPGVVWPAQNMPLELWEDGATWSASFGRKLDSAGVTVSISQNGGSKTWEISSSGGNGTLTVSNANYGQPGCVMFTPDTISYDEGDSYHVVIKENGSLLAQYDVNFFNALEQDSNSSSQGADSATDNDASNRQDEDNPTATAEEVAKLKTQSVTDIARVSTMDTYSTDDFSVYFSWSPVGTDEYNYYLNGSFIGYTTVDDLSEEDGKIYIHFDSGYENLKRGHGYALSVEPDYWVNRTHVLGKTTSLKFATKPYKVTNVSVKQVSSKKSGKVTISWSKKTGTGYQVQIATNSSFTKGKKTYKISSSSTLKKTVSGLKTSKKYYVRVRAYKTYGTTAYGNWSKAKLFKLR